MKVLFASLIFALVGATYLAGQVIPPPTIPKRQDRQNRPGRPAQQAEVYLVTFRPDISPNERAAVAQMHGARVRMIYRAVNAASVELPDAAALARLRNDNRILSIVASRPISFVSPQGRGSSGSGSKPKAPTNLGASAISSSQIVLVWTDASNNESGFAIERCAGSGCTNFTEIWRVGADVATFGDVGLTALQTYRYRVLAFNAVGDSKYSNIAEAMPPALPSPPAAPSNLSAIAVSYSQINLSWSDNSNNESGFQLERCAGTLANCVNFVEAAAPTANVTGFNDNGLLAQTPYTYRVRAVNSVGLSAYSNSIEATTPVAPPAAPSNLTAMPISYSQVNLSWSDNSNNETGFQLERCAGTMANCVNFALAGSPNANVTAFNDTGVLAQTTYTYRIRAVNSAGPSPYSNSIEAMTPASPPLSPSNLTATVVSFSQINLNWSDNSNNETGFQLERCIDTIANCVNFVPITAPNANVTGFNNTGLQPLTTYTYRVRAVNSAGPSSYSNSIEATTPGAPPQSPSNLTATVVSYSQINLSWSDNSNNEDGFQLERCDGAMANCVDFALILSPNANVTSFNNTGLQPLTTYTYRVRAVNSVGPSSYSNSIEARTAVAPPQSPSNLTATVVSYSQINLNWSDNSNNEDGFQLERCAGTMANCVNFGPAASPNANVTSFNDVGLMAQTTYTYRVRAVNSSGPSAYSSSIEATTLAAPPPPPSAPSNLAATVVSYSQINLNWSDNSNNEDGFQLERCAGAMANCVNFALAGSPNANVTSFNNNTGLQPLTTYTYRVRAINAAGPSAYSNSIEATTLAGPPQSPSNLNTTVISYNQINLNWSDNSNNEDGFELERCAGAMANCVNFALAGSPNANVTSFNNTGLQPLTTYTYRVRAVNSVGPSSYSNSIEARTLVAPPQSPSNLTSTVVSSSQINLNWSDNSNNEDGFNLERCIGTMASCVNFVPTASPSANVTSFNNTGLPPQTTYTYRVRAFNSTGPSAYSNSIEATTQAAPPSTQVVPAGVQRIGAAPGRLTWTGAGVGVAVVDTGLDFNHLDLVLAPEIQGVNAYNAYGGSCQDFHGHGTHVGGIIAARNNTIDVVGVAPNATLYCVTVFEPDPVEGAVGTDEALMAGLDWVLTNADLVTPRIRVVNMSLGRDKTPDDDNPNNPLHLMFKALYDHGISLVVAAGNDQTREVTQQIPAGYPEVMAVASTTAQTGVNGYDEYFTACVGVPSIKADTASYFTTDGAFRGGTGVTVSAPGETQEDIFSYFDSCFLEPIGILSTALDGGTVELSGTSMSSPHVAGVVALMWEKELSLGLNLAPEVARTRIRNNVDRLGTAPLDSPTEDYSFDTEREGVIWAPSAVGDFPPPHQDSPPTVTIVKPAPGSSFSAGASIVFQGTATDTEDGNIAAALDWTSDRDGHIGTGGSFTRTLSNGNHVITTTVTDSGGNTRSATTSISVGASSNPTTVHAASVTYVLQGFDRLIYTVHLENEFGGPVAGATVEVDLYEYIFTGDLWISTGTTNNQGNVQFQLYPADFGCYVTSVRNVVAPGLTWVTGTPSNNFCNF